MTRHNTDRTTAGRECERCGRERTEDSKRYRITVDDYSDGTAAYQQFLLCPQCWRSERRRLERCSA